MLNRGARAVTGGEKKKHSTDSQMENKQYCVVEFQDRGTAVVPSCWLKGDKCSWPPYNSQKLQRSVRQREISRPDWTVHDNVRCLVTCVR
ncbi:hypothetical protein MHYP_G00361820 [Metynnis hypsauchen]